MGVGMEQTAVQALISPLTGAHLLSGVGDVAGWTHADLDTAPATTFVNWPAAVWSTVVDLDWAGNDPQIIVRTGNGGGQVALSTDAGNTWTTDTNANSGSSGSGIAISASGTSILWRQSSGNFVVSRNAGAYNSVSGLPNGAHIASDKTNDSVFYGASGSTVYVSTDGGATFSTSTTVTGSINDIKVNPLVTGDVWVATTSGLSHSTNSANSFTALTTVATASKVAVGAASASGKPNSVFVGGTVSGVEGYFRSDDTGKTWVQVSDAKHQFTGVSGPLVADPRVFGRLYLGTNGRGIFYGDIS
jgi:xyloglucan-specific exo-beta-1,4-glucanase